MKRLSIKWRLFLRRILVVCSSGFLAAGACTDEARDMYGMPPVVSGTVRAADTRKPIKGIQVSVAETSYKTTTSAQGYFEFGYYVIDNTESGTLLFTDIDGAKNGEFHGTNVSWDTNNRYHYVFLERK